MIKNTLFKPLFSAVCLLLCLLLTVGCSKTSNESLSPTEIVQSVRSAHAFSSMNALSGDKLSAYFQFSDTDVKRFCVYISSSNESADVIASFEYYDDAAKAIIMNGISHYLNNKAAVLKGSFETEFQKNQNRVLMQIGSTITLVICEDPAAVQKQLSEMNGAMIA